MTPTIRTLLLVTLLAGCGDSAPPETLITNCHANGYSAHYMAGDGRGVRCCSRLNGDEVCLRSQEVTRHRRETGQ